MVAERAYDTPDGKSIVARIDLTPIRGVSWRRSVRRGTHAQIEVEDNGPGMMETVRKRIFEPFYTTKDVGDGTGLGLSVSYFIITENHGGTMRVESSEGKGTKFVIRLPL